VRFHLDAVQTRFLIRRRLNNPEKGAVTHAVVHRALWEYLSTLCELENEAEREKLWREIFEMYDLRCLSTQTRPLVTYLFRCQDVLAEMVHTKDGSRLVREFIVRGSAKVIKKHELEVYEAQAVTN